MNIGILKALAAIFSVAVIALTAIFGVIPQWENYQAKLAEAENTDLLVNAEIGQLNRLRELSEKQDAIQLQIDFLNQAIPTTQNISSYIDVIDVLAIRNSVLIESLIISDPIPYLLPENIAKDEAIAPAVSVAGPNLQSVNMTFVVKGMYDPLLAFVGELQLAPRTTLVRSVTLSGGFGPDEYSMTIEAAIFFRSAPAQ